MTDSRPFPTPDEADIIAALGQTGFLLEQQVAQSLEARGIEEVQTGFPFTDAESGKTREIDVLASEWRHVGDRQMHCPLLAAELIIECKNTLSPFAIVGQRADDKGYGGKYGYGTEFDPLHLRFEKRPYTSTYHMLDFAGLPGRPFELGFHGRQLVKLNLQSGKWKANNDGVYDGIMYPLAKAQVFRYSDDYVELNQPQELSAPCFNFYYPILLTAGPIHTVAVENSGVTVQEVGWAPVSRELRESGPTGKFTVEVVKFSELTVIWITASLACCQAWKKRFVLTVGISTLIG